MARPNSNDLLLGGAVLVGVAVWSEFFGPDARDEGFDHLNEWRNPPTLTGARFAVLADVMDQALFGGVGEDEEAIYRVLRELRTDGDFFELVRAFGIRSNWYTLGDATLPQAMLYYLDPDELQTCNDILAGLGIEVSL